MKCSGWYAVRKKYITIKAAKEWLKNRESEITNSRNGNANFQKQETDKPSAGGASEDNTPDTRPPSDEKPSKTKPVLDNAHPPFQPHNTPMH